MHEVPGRRSHEEMADFTAGDWHNYGPIIHVNGQHLAHVCELGNGRGCEEQRANAAVMTAAPKLVAALVRLLWAEEWSVSADRMESAEKAKLIRDALEIAGVYP